MPRAHDLDFNPGGLVNIDGDTPITKFGFDYSTTTDLFATIVRIRNVNCDGFSPYDYTVSPWDTGTFVTYRIADGSSAVPEIAHIHVRDSSILTWRSGTIGSNRLEAFDGAVVFIIHSNVGGVPALFDGEVASIGAQPIVVDRVHTIQRVNLDTGETEAIQVIHHGTGIISILQP